MAGVLPATDRLPLVLFDGVCNLCNASVRFIIDRDPEGVFCFAPLQSDVGQAWVARHHAEADPADSVVLIDADGYHTRSTAALRIARRLSLPWRLLYGFVVVPRPLRDALYAFIARNRYRWFGREETCRLPTPDEQARFLPYELPSAP